MYLLINEIWNAEKTKVIGNNPQTLKLTQNSSDCVLHTVSLSKAKIKKKYIHLLFNIFHPSSVKGNDFPRIFFNIGSSVKYFPKNNVSQNKIFIIVGLI